jgi:hypothetical protein
MAVFKCTVWFHTVDLLRQLLLPRILPFGRVPAGMTSSILARTYVTSFPCYELLLSWLGGLYITLACEIASLKRIATHPCVSWAKNATQQHPSLQKFVAFGTGWKRTFHDVVLENRRQLSPWIYFSPNLFFTLVWPKLFLSVVWFGLRGTEKML